MTGHTLWTELKRKKEFVKPIKACKEDSCKNFAAEGRSRCYSCYGKKRRTDNKRIVPKAPEGKLRMLMLDIETTPNRTYSWGLFKQNIGINQIIEPGGLLCFAAKWYGQEEIEFYSQWDDGDLKMAIEAWRLLDECDVVVHFYGCVAPGNRVLTKDLKWVDVATLKVGDELLTIEESLTQEKRGKGSGKARKYKTATVLHASPIQKECYEIELSNGTKITASEDHPWLTRIQPNYPMKFVETKDLEGYPLLKMLDPWETDNSYEAGYLAAFMDGEGCLNQSKREEGRNTNLFNVSFSQKSPEIIAKLTDCLDAKGFSWTSTVYDKNHLDMRKILVTGGLSESLKFMGSVRPSKLDQINYCSLETNQTMVQEDVKIIAIKPVGIQTVIGLETSSGTYFVEGFPCHNSQFDIPHLNTHFLKQGFPPPSPFKQIDLKLAVGKQFKFTSNKLQFVSEVLGLAGKEEHEGFGLWDKVMNETGKYTTEIELDAKARMTSYNKQDVFLLDEVYQAVLPWIPSHPHRHLYEDGRGCPTCGADTEFMQQEGYYYTKLSKFKKLRCIVCDSWFRSTRREAGVAIQEAVL